MFLYGIGHADPFEWRIEIYNLVIVRYLRSSVKVEGCFLNDFFGEVHHPVIVFVGYIDLHHCELRVMCTVHTFIPEVLCKFINSFKAPHYQSLKVEFICYPEVKRNIESVMVSNKRACCCSSGNWLKYWCFNFKITIGVEKFAHRLYYLAAFSEDIAYLWIYNQIHIPLPVAHLAIGYCIEKNSVLFLNYR